MNAGIMLKAFREVWPITLLLSAAALAAEMVLAYVLPTFQRQFSQQVLEIPFLQSVIQAMLGVELHGQIGGDMIVSIAWVHPVVLATFWAHAIVCCTRVPAAEIDRGTIDVLMSLPVSRWRVYRSETVVWIAATIVLLMFAFIGNRIGALGVPAEARGQPLRQLAVMFNLFWLSAAVGCLAWLMSAMSDRRGRAMAVVFVVLLASFLLNFLAQFWEPAKSVRFLSIMQYYRPLPMLQGQGLPWGDLAVLAGLASACWLGGGMAFAHRDLNAR